MNKQLISIFLLTFLCYSSLSAQDYLRHEFAVGGNIAMTDLKSKMAVGESKGKMSGGIGFGYTYFFRKELGFSTGLDFAFYSSEAKLGSFSDKNQAFDIDIQKAFEFRYTVNDYIESQSAFYLNIPLMLNYQFGGNDKFKLFGAGGFKIGIPVNGKYKTTGAKIETSGYYPHDESIITDIEYRGFGDFIGRDYNNTVKYKMSLNLAVEGGVKWTLPNEMFLYTSLYLDYGLNNVKKEVGEERFLIQYNQINPSDHIYSGFNASSYLSDDGLRSSLTNKVNLVAYGLKIRLAFGK